MDVIKCRTAVVSQFVQPSEGKSTGVVVLGDMEEAEGDCEAQEQAANHTHWEEEGELTSVEPTAQENKHIK